MPLSAHPILRPVLLSLAVGLYGCAEGGSRLPPDSFGTLDSSVTPGVGIGATTTGAGAPTGSPGSSALGGTGVTPTTTWPDAGASGGQPRSEANTPATPGGTLVPGGTDAAIPNSDAGPGQPGTAHADAGVQLPGVRAKPFCMQKDSQLIIIGDSYISWISHSFPSQLARESGQNWRMEAVGGSSIGSGGIADIPSQFDLSIGLDPDAHTVLMDGGGNDVLLADPLLDPTGACTNTGSSQNANCQEIIKVALDSAKSLMDRMVTKGIRDVIYFFYPHVPANTILTGNNPNEILDYALPKAKALCDDAEPRTSGKLRCTFVDMVPVFKGRTGLFNSDIHPNDQGSALMAKKVWEVMTQSCIGQKGPKECCESK